MNKASTLFALLLFICTDCGKARQSSIYSKHDKADVAVMQSETKVEDSEKLLPAGVRILQKVYPDAGIKYDNGYIVFPDGERILYDDGKSKDFVAMLDNSDVEDMFSMAYDTLSATPSYMSDAGRSRCEALFKKMYGKSAAQVESRMETVNWFGQRIRFTKVNGASRQLRRVADELRGMPHLAKFLTPASTFYWRNVRGAKRMSAHSYGIAIDINVKMSDYWLWANPKKAETAKIEYKNRIPHELVRVFEKHGFVWGGRWYHYDTMHFEYRPELLCSVSDYKQE